MGLNGLPTARGREAARTNCGMRPVARAIVWHAACGHQFIDFARWK